MVARAAGYRRRVAHRKPFLSKAAVWKWLRKGQPLPPEHVLKVEAETGVSRHDLRPDIYPPEAPAHRPDLEPAR